MCCLSVNGTSDLAFPRFLMSTQEFGTLTYHSVDGLYPARERVVAPVVMNRERS